MTASTKDQVDQKAGRQLASKDFVTHDLAILFKPPTRVTEKTSSREVSLKLKS